jgi:GNAT superfamily N-acetyltransferase
MIRIANKFDVPQILDMLRNYRDSGKIYGVKDITDEATPIRILTHILAGGGLAYVDQKDNELIGMLLAVKTPYLWDHSKFVMNEIVYWVEPEHRGSTTGYRLLSKYIEHCDNLVEDNIIVNYTMSQMEGQQLNYSRFGLRPIEHTWSN